MSECEVKVFNGHIQPNDVIAYPGPRGMIRAVVKEVAVRKTGGYNGNLVSARIRVRRLDNPHPGKWKHWLDVTLRNPKNIVIIMPAAMD